MNKNNRLPDHVAVHRSGPDTAVLVNNITGNAVAFRCLGDDLNDILDVQVMITSDKKSRIFLIGSPIKRDIKGPQETFRLCLEQIEAPWR